MTTRQIYELLRAEIGKLEAENTELFEALSLLLATILSDNVLKEIGLDGYKQAITAAVAAIEKANRKKRK